MALKLTSSSQGVSFSVKVVPGASKNSVVGVEGEFLKVRLTAPPVEGRANQALVELLSKLLRVPKSRVHILRGLSSKQKSLLVENYDAAQFREFLSKLDS
jgi:uncharacterized protein (TIGR00251 family)